MVAIDDDAKAQGIPPLILTNEEEKKRSLAALERRQSRLELKQKLNERGL
jgi:acyl-CoA hydrolase